jgi:hypothetical protein
VGVLTHLTSTCAGSISNSGVSAAYVSSGAPPALARESYGVSVACAKLRLGRSEALDEPRLPPLDAFLRHYVFLSFAASLVGIRLIILTIGRPPLESTLRYLHYLHSSRSSTTYIGFLL